MPGTEFEITQEFELKLRVPKEILIETAGAAILLAGLLSINPTDVVTAVNQIQVPVKDVLGGVSNIENFFQASTSVYYRISHSYFII